MYIIKIFVAADRVHIGVKSVSYVETVFLKSHSLPFCQGVYDLCVFSDGRDIKGYRTLLTRKVIVKTGSGGNEKRSGNSL